MQITLSFFRESEFVSKKVGVIGLPALWRKTAGRAVAGGAAPCGLETDSTCLFPGSCRVLRPDVASDDILHPCTAKSCFPRQHPGQDGVHSSESSTVFQAGVPPQARSMSSTLAPRCGPNIAAGTCCCLCQHVWSLTPRRRGRAVDNGDLLTKALKGPLATSDFNPFCDFNTPHVSVSSKARCDRFDNFFS